MNKISHSIAYPSRKHKIQEKKKNTLNWTIVPAYIGLVATAFSVYYTSRNVKENEKWKKGEFIANQFEKYNIDTSVQFVSNYLDYYSRLVQIQTEQTENIHRDEIAEYLFPAHLSSDIDPLKRAVVRNHFDEYLDRLSVFNRYVNSKLVTVEDIKPYLKYQIDIIGNPSNEDHLRTFQEAFWGYIARYGFYDVQELFCKFGYNIFPQKQITNCRSNGSELNELISDVSSLGSDTAMIDEIIQID